MRAELNQWLAGRPVGILPRDAEGTEEALQTRLLNLQAEAERVKEEIHRLQLRKNTGKAIATVGYAKLRQASRLRLFNGHGVAFTIYSFTWSPFTHKFADSIRQIARNFGRNLQP